MPSTCCSSETVSNGAFFGPYESPAALYCAISAPFGRVLSSESIQSCTASDKACALSSGTPCVTNRFVRRSALFAAALMSTLPESSVIETSISASP